MASVVTNNDVIFKLRVEDLKSMCDSELPSDTAFNSSVKKLRQKFSSLKKSVHRGNGKKNLDDFFAK